MLLPLVRLLLRTGISFREFAKLAKMAFVQAATEDYGIRGRPTNISRIAVMTGLTRKEVKSIRDIGWQYSAKLNEDWWETNFPPSDILHFWYTDLDFCGSDGQPRELPFSGEFPSFTDLTSRYAGDIPPGAMRVELKRTKSVEENAGGMLRPIKRYCIPYDLDIHFVQTIGYSLSRIFETILLNSKGFSGATNGTFQPSGNFEKYVWTQNLSREDMAEFKEYAEDKAMKLLVELDDWIGQREQNVKDSQKHQDVRLSQRLVQNDCGLGIYYFGD